MTHDFIEELLRPYGIKVNSITLDRESYRYGYFFEDDRITIEGTYDNPWHNKSKWSRVPNPISKVIFNPPATIVYWKDGAKTVVKCQDGDIYDKEIGLVTCIAKKMLGNRSNFNNLIKRYTEQ